ncbi:MAG TPA: CBS domain-containing protein [Spirochaetota bacterium]|nr:CBS domain-containing protein [Spirochaetota bacterium]HPJ40745.1 CBS domain-containing protein [Spirochaetota bacterium]HPR36014.1 CBS domain-containing protein [Spirochaetota bacterium]
MKKISAKDIMSSPVITTKAHVVVSDFITALIEYGISGLPVVDDNNRLTGIVTRTDLLVFELKRELSSLYEKSIKGIFTEYKETDNWPSFSDMIDKFNRTITVNDLMTINVITATEETPVNEICRIMKEQKINHVVITADREIRGIVTSRDIISLVASG